MSEIQFKSRITNRHDVSLEGIYFLDIPDGTYKMINDAFKKWEVRRGFISEDKQKLGLRGRAYSYGQFANKKKQEQQKTVKKKAPKKTCKVISKKKK